MTTYISFLRLISQGLESFEENPSRLDSAMGMFQRLLRLTASVGCLILLLVSFPITLAGATLQDISHPEYDVFESTDSRLIP